jgi:hypothetical protein
VTANAMGNITVTAKQYNYGRFINAFILCINTALTAINIITVGATGIELLQVWPAVQQHLYQTKSI